MLLKGGGSNYKIVKVQYDLNNPGFNCTNTEEIHPAIHFPFF